MSTQPGIALVTGATSGLGAEFARQLAAKGWRVVVTGQNPERLAAIEQETNALLAVRHDLTQPDAAFELVNQLKSNGIAIDLLVNNAGLTSYAAFADTDLDHQLDVIRVNVIALTELTHRLLPGMIARGSGRILNVASAAAYMPGPLQAVYYATKAYVLSFSEALDQELKSTGITVTTLTPGPIRTRFEERGDLGKNRLFNSSLIPVSTPKDVARAGIEGALAGKGAVVPNRRTRIPILLARVLPRGLQARAVDWLHRG